MPIGGGRQAVAAVLASIALVALGAAPASAFRTGGSAWSGRPATISYWNGSPYKAEVRAAVRAWNRSGARVRFVRVPRGSARVPITVLRDGSLGGPGQPLGFASIGFQGRNYVHLAPPRRWDRALLTTVIAHELGHVLGLDHEARRCATMNAPVWAGCGRTPPCGVLQADDIRGAVARYGGRVRRAAPVLCPSAPTGLRVAPAGQSYDMALRAHTPPGAGLDVRVAPGERCPARPAGARGAAAAPTETSLGLGPDPAAFRGKRYCVSAWSVDERGRHSPRHATLRFTGDPGELPAPTGVRVTPGSYRLTLAWDPVRFAQAERVELAAAYGESCPAGPEDGVPELRTVAFADFGREAAATLRFDRRGPVCVALWTRDRFGTLSGRTTVRAEVSGNLEPQAAFGPPSDPPAPGVAVAFTDTSSDPENALTAWAWDFGDPGSGPANTSTERNPAHTFTAPGTYTVTLRVTDDGGATSETSQEILVEAPPP